MGSGESKPVNRSVFGSPAPAPVLGSPVASYGAPGGGRRRSNRRGRGKTMRGGQCKTMYGGMHKGKSHSKSKGSRRNKSKSRSKSRGRRHH